MLLSLLLFTLTAVHLEVIGQGEVHNRHRLWLGLPIESLALVHALNKVAGLAFADTGVAIRFGGLLVHGAIEDQETLLTANFLFVGFGFLVVIGLILSFIDHNMLEMEILYALDLLPSQLLLHELEVLLESAILQRLLFWFQEVQVFVLGERQWLLHPKNINQVLVDGLFGELWGQGQGSSPLNKSAILLQVASFLFLIDHLADELGQLNMIGPTLRFVLAEDQDVLVANLKCSQLGKVNAFLAHRVVVLVVGVVFFQRGEMRRNGIEHHIESRIAGEYGIAD